MMFDILKLLLSIPPMMWIVLIPEIILAIIGASTKRYKLCAFGVLLIFLTILAVLTYIIVEKTGISKTIGNVCILGVTTFVLSFSFMFIVTELLLRNRAKDVRLMLEELLKKEEEAKKDEKTREDEEMKKDEKAMEDEVIKKLIDKLIDSDKALSMLSEVVFRPILYLTIRRSILITFTVVYFYLLSISIDPSFWSGVNENVIEYVWNRNPFVQIFTYIYLASVAFYFGTRFIETYKLIKGEK